MSDLSNTAKIIIDDGRLLSNLITFSILTVSIANFIRDTKIELPTLEFSEKILIFYSHAHAFFVTICDIFTSWMDEMELSELVKDISLDNFSTCALALNLMLLMNDQEKIRIPSIISMLLWSIKMVLNEIYIEPSYELAVRGTIAAILMVSSICLFRKTKKDNLNVSKNGSFHKITTEAYDESDTEVDFNDTNSFSDLQSTRTAVFSQSSRLLNSSFRSNLVEPVKTFKSNSTITNFPTNIKPNDIVSNKSFSIRQEVMAADHRQVQNDITKLNISDLHNNSFFSNSSTLKDFNSVQCSNPFSLEKSRCGSPTPSVASIFSGSARGQMISPPRLHSPLVYTSDATQSWVAGGYWQSPQKKYLESAKFQTKPVISRSSSQSSGLGTIDSEKNSRENSLGQEDGISSVYSDAIAMRKRNIFEKPALVASPIFGDSHCFNPPKSQSFFSTYSNANSNNSFRKYRDTNTFFK